MRAARKIVLAGALLLACCASVESVEPEPLVVWSDLDNPPFAAVATDGEAYGRDVEMMQDLASALGRPLVWHRVPFEQLLPAVAAGEALVVCATLGVTPERERHAAFSTPYFETVIAVVVRADEGEPRSLAELAGRRVAAGTGTTAERAVRLQLRGSVAVFENKTGLTSAERVLQRDVDAIAMDGPNAEALIAAANGRLARIPADLAVERYALAVAKTERVLLRELDAAIAELHATGRLRELDRKYGLSNPP